MVAASRRQARANGRCKFPGRRCRQQEAAPLQGSRCRAAGGGELETMTVRRRRCDGTATKWQRQHRYCRGTIPPPTAPDEGPQQHRSPQKIGACGGLPPERHQNPSGAAPAAGFTPKFFRLRRAALPRAACSGLRTASGLRTGEARLSDRRSGIPNLQFFRSDHALTLSTTPHTTYQPNGGAPCPAAQQARWH